MRDRIPIYEPDLSGNELAYVTDCVRSGWVSSLGSYVAKFEEAFSEFCGAEYGVGVSSGTVALHLALVALGVGPGDEVIVPTLTFVATASAVRHAGAKPIFVDSGLTTWTIDPQGIEERITPRTKAIMPVHLYGHPAEMDPICAIAKEHGLAVIEDAAEAHGAEYKGQRVGSIGHAGCFSFFGNKIVTTGEGGMIVTGSRELAERARLLRDHAMSKERRYWHLEVGYSYRLTNLQAAIGLAQVERIDDLVEKKRRIARWYEEGLKEIRGISLPPEATWAKNVYWMYSILVEDEFGMRRDEVMLRLQEKGIDTHPFFYPLHTMPPFRGEEGLPVAEELSRKGINLPSGVTLTRKEVEYICQTLSSLGP